MDCGLTESMISYLFEGSFKKQAKFHRFVQQWKESVILTLEPVSSESHLPSSAGPRYVFLNVVVQRIICM